MCTETCLCSAKYPDRLCYLEGVAIVCDDSKQHTIQSTAVVTSALSKYFEAYRTQFNIQVDKFEKELALP